MRTKKTAVLTAAMVLALMLSLLLPSSAFAATVDFMAYDTPRVTLVVGESFTNTLTITPPDAVRSMVGPVTTQDPLNPVISIVSFDTIQAVAPGTTIVSVRDAMSGLSAAYEVTVLPIASSISYLMPSINLLIGDTFSNTLTITPTDAYVELGLPVSSDPTVVTVIDDTTIEAVGAGVATITITDAVSGLATSYAVSVTAPPATGIAFTYSGVNLELGDTFVNPLIITPSYGITDLTAPVSSDTSVVQIMAPGLGSTDFTIDAVGYGTATVSITDQISGQTASYLVTVAPEVPLEDVEYIPSTLFVNSDGTYNVDLFFTPFDATDQTGNATTTGDVTLIDSETLSVSNAASYSFGEVIGTMTFTSNDGGFTTTVTVVKGIPITDLILDRDNLSIRTGGVDIVNLNIMPIDASEDINISFSGTGQVTVLEVSPGVYEVEGVAPGLAVVTFATEGGVSARLFVMVSASSPLTLSGLPAVVRVGDTFTLTPSIDDQTGSAGWNWNAAYLSATFNSPATFTALRAGTTTVTYTNTSGQTASVTFTILPRGGGRPPRTGDANGLLIAAYSVVGLAAAGAAGFLVTKKRKNKKEPQ